MDLRKLSALTILSILATISVLTLFLTLSSVRTPYLGLSEKYYEGVRLIICESGVPSSPALIVVHGGRPSSKAAVEFCKSFCEKLGDLKLTVISVDYPDGLGLTEEVEQVVKAIKFAETSRFIDGERICVLGTSRGGYLALMAAVRTEIRCVVDAYGPTDLEEMFKHARGDPALWSEWERYYVDIMMRLDVDGQDIGERLRDFSPIYNVFGLEEDVLIMHGLQDTSVPPTHSLMLEEAFKSVGKSNYVIRLYGEEVHGFSLLSGRPYHDLRLFLSEALARDRPG